MGEGGQWLERKGGGRARVGGMGAVNSGKEWGKGVNCAKVRGGEGGMNGEGKISLPFNYIHRLITYSRYFFCIFTTITSTS